MSKTTKPRARIAVPGPKGFVEKEILNDDEQQALTVCPETGRSLDTVDPRKHAATLWPTLDPDNLPNTEAGRRYQLLLDEADRRDAERD